ncbi:MAG: hypothetical protein L7F78_01225 [Syntrophales bacterium LBB04]|nr:hypothetical protein [Syntrophales bacterium LBB04]
MNNQEFKRKLTAILSADVKGYSRLMGEDEDHGRSADFGNLLSTLLVSKIVL